ncbi:MAG TPA: hypothetical protein VER96_08835 [Polyangiaceae bacterium]|nr:hypothetical protein [Polyangiaceae bacterium]
MNAVRQRWLLALGFGLSLASRVGAKEPPFQASLSCPPVTGPGRIVCELSARATEGRLVWSDALVVRAPAFARPLRSRFVAQLGSAATSGAASAKLALVASQAGEGKLELLARGVICREGPAGEWCGPVQAPLIVELRVAASAP